METMGEEGHGLEMPRSGAVKKSFGSETELAAKVVAWLEKNGWTVYQEVQLRHSGPRADIIATRPSPTRPNAERNDTDIWIIECKNSFSAQVVDQADSWKHAHKANYVSVAVPYSKGALCLTRYMETQGIGMLRVGVGGVFEATKSTWAPVAGRSILPKLMEGHKDYAKAGNAAGKFFTPFVATCQKVKAFVRANPGCEFNAMVDGIEHHYASKYGARASLRYWIQRSKIPGVRSSIQGRKTILFPVLTTEDFKAAVEVVDDLVLSVHEQSSG